MCRKSTPLLCIYLLEGNEKKAAKYYPDVVTKQRKRFLAKHNLAYVDLHGLRHTYCTMLIAAGVDAKTVQQLMGHSDPRMTMKLYAHKVDEKVLATRGTVANYLEEVA